MKLLINFCGGPSVGKSAMAAGTFSELKWRGESCELVTEFAKDKVWEESIKMLDDQIYVFGQQLHRVNRLRDKVNIVLTDSPLLNSIVYYTGAHAERLFALVRDVEMSFNVVNVVIDREHAYEIAGRYHTEEQANDAHSRVKQELAELGRDYVSMTSCRENAIRVAEAIVSAAPRYESVTVLSALMRR